MKPSKKQYTGKDNLYHHIRTIRRLEQDEETQELSAVRKQNKMSEEEGLRILLFCTVLTFGLTVLGIFYAGVTLLNHKNDQKEEQEP